MQGSCMFKLDFRDDLRPGKLLTPDLFKMPKGRISGFEHA